MSQNQDVLAEIKNAALSESPPPRPSTKPTLLDVDSQDPDLRLRVVRSARESIRFAAQEDERRQIGKRRRRRDNLQSFFGSFKRGRSSSSASASEKAGSFLRPNSQPPAQNHRASFFQEEQTAKAENFVEAKPEDGAPQKGAESRRRRTVNVNVALSALELDHRAQPLARYARNKVKTSKYSILTFIPKVSARLMGTNRRNHR